MARVWYLNSCWFVYALFWSLLLVTFMLSKELVFVFTLVYENNIFRSDNRGELREEDKSQVWFVHKIFN